MPSPTHSMMQKQNTDLANEELDNHDVAVTRAHVVKELGAADVIGDVWGCLAGVWQPVCGQVRVAVGHQRVLHIQLHTAQTQQSSSCPYVSVPARTARKFCGEILEDAGIAQIPIKCIVRQTSIREVQGRSLPPGRLGTGAQ